MGKKAEATIKADKKGKKFLDIRKALDKEFPNFIKSGNDISKASITRIPSGVFMFDLLTGGGIAEGRVNIFHGNKSCGKTSMTYRIINSYLKMYPNRSTLYIDAEHTFEKPWADNFISDWDRVHVLQPDYGEQCIDILVRAMDAEDLGLVVVDSTAMMIPTVEADASADEDKVGLLARLINKMFRKILPKMSQAKRLEGRLITVLLVNQVRVKFGGKTFQTTMQKPGGVMQDLVATMDIRFVTKQYTQKGSLTTKVTHGFVLEKNKAGLPKRSGEYQVFLVPSGFYRPGESDDVAVVTTYAKKCGLIAHEGNQWLLGKKHTFPNLAQLDTFLRGDRKSFEKVKAKTLEVCLRDVTVGDEEAEEGEAAD